MAGEFTVFPAPVPHHTTGRDETPCGLTDVGCCQFVCVKGGFLNTLVPELTSTAPRPVSVVGPA